MRIAIVTESYFPQVNGVSNSVRHVVRRLGERGHEVLVVAPGPGPTCVEGVPVHRARSVDLPRYRTSARFAPAWRGRAGPCSLSTCADTAARTVNGRGSAVSWTSISR